MRIWDLDPSLLCRQHLLGEHRELHGLWNVLTQGKKGYANHPETKRWVGRTKALWNRHQALVSEMEKRGYLHASPIDASHATGPDQNRRRVHSNEEQLRLLAAKPCSCPLNAAQQAKRR